MTSLISRPAKEFAISIVCPPVGSDSRAATSVAEPIAPALREPNSHATQDDPPPNYPASRGLNSGPATVQTTPNAVPPVRPNSRPAISHAAPGNSPPGGARLTDRHSVSDTQPVTVVGAGEAQDRAAIPAAESGVQTLLDPALALAADFLDDIERVKLANENRLRALTRVGTDADGVDRYVGLDADHPVVEQLAKMVASLAEVEHAATLNLQRMVRKHPLGAWIKATKGVGEKQGARLLAAIGDPYVRPEWTRDGITTPEGPRTVSALWAYCGLHVLPGGQVRSDTHGASAAGDQAGAGGDSGQDGLDTHYVRAGVAARRRRGTQANWSENARMRAWNIAESCKKQLVKPCTGVSGERLAEHVEGCACAPYRLLYDAGRTKYRDAIHDHPCVRCGPKGKPAAAGSPLGGAHQEARALRLVMKEVLKDLWRAAREWHLKQAEASE